MGSKSNGMKSIAAIVWIVCSCTLPARAALGEMRDSIHGDVQTLKGELTTREMSGYSIEQITRADGATLREVVSPQGLIFGIAWQGPTMPNLTQVLGPSSVAFQKATQPVHRRGPLSVHVGQLVVETGGHMRAFHVRAYLVNLVPAGISEDVVQ